MNLKDVMGHFVRPKLAEDFVISVINPEADESEEMELANAALDSVSGLAIIIDYVGADKVASQRLITCRQYSVRDGKHYLAAFCHHRQALRHFRVDRIHGVYNPETGESHGDVTEYFAQYTPNEKTQSGLSWNLSVERKADLLAMLNAMVFVARADREYHPLERSSLESAICRFWLWLELAGEPDCDAIINYADRLAPDGEIFWVALHRMQQDPRLPSIFKHSVRELIDADGHIRPEEVYWGNEIDQFFP